MAEIKVFTFNTVQENTYILYDETGQAAIIDCGCMGPSEEAQVESFISEQGLTPRLLLNTHLHFDHCWGNPWALRRWPELKAYCHPKELTDQPRPSEQLRLFGLSLRFEDVPEERYQLIHHGDELEFGTTKLQVLDVPGHSPGHVVFYCQDSALAIVGDTLFRGGIGRTDLWAGDYDQLISHIQRNLLTLPPETAIYTGHDAPSTIAHELKHNPYFN